MLAAVTVGLLGLAAPAHAVDLWGVTPDDELVRIDPATPGVLVGDPLPIGGIGGEPAVGLATYGGALELLTASGRGYRLDPRSAQAEEDFELCVPAEEAGAMASNWGRFSLHTVSAGDTWSSFAPPCGETLTGEPVRETGPVAYEGGPPDPHIVATTFHHGTQFGVDVDSDKLVQRPDRGEWSEVGALEVDVAPPVALEQAGDTTYLAAGGTLYSVDRATGTATVVGPIGTGLDVRDMAAVPPPTIVFRSIEWPPLDVVGEGVTESTLLTREGDPLPEITASYEFGESPFAPPATPGEDFVAGSGTVTFAPGQRHQMLQLPNVDDDVPEEDESFDLRLADGTDDVVPSHSGMPILIVDDDLGVEVPPVAVPESAGAIELPASRGTPLGYATTLGFVPSAGGTALAGQDYVVPDPVTVARGGTQGTLRLPIVDDRSEEGTETIVLERATLAPFSRMTQRVVVQIGDDDAPPAVVGDPPAPGADTTAPAIRIAGRSVRRLRRGRLTVAFTCSERCSARATLALDRRSARRLRLRRRLARAVVDAAPAKVTRVRLHVGRRAARRLRGARRAPVRLTIVARDAAGNVGRARRTLTLRR